MRASLAFVVALVAAVGGSPAPASTQTINLARRSFMLEDGTLDEDAFLHMLDRTLIKYNEPGLENLHGDKAEKRDGGATTLSLADQLTPLQEDLLYYGKGKVGKTEFTFDFDTGSADIFVAGPNCKGCTTKARYDNSGCDQKKQTSVTYGSGMVAGNIFKDTVSIGGLKADEQAFLSLVNSTGFAQSKADGIMGMAFSSIAKTKSPTFFENLIKQGSVKDKEFSFYLGRARSNTQQRSSITLGGRDPKQFYGRVTKCPVTSKTYWQIAMEGVKVDGKDIDKNAVKGSAAIDTGTSIIIGPTKAVAAIMAKIPGATPISIQQKTNTYTFYSFPCNLDKKFVPSLTFGGQDLAINPLDFNRGKLEQGSSKLLSLSKRGAQTGPGTTATQPPSTQMCVAGIAGVDLANQPGLYIVGDIFLKNWYSIFSYDGPSVSFAAAVGNQ